MYPHMLASYPSTLVKGTTLRISNEEMNDITEINQSHEVSGLLIIGISKTIKNGAKEQKREFFRVLLRNLSAILLGNLLSGKGTIIAGEGTIRASQNCQGCLIL